jgi:ATP-dependent DNA helicase RecQ
VELAMPRTRAKGAGRKSRVLEDLSVDDQTLFEALRSLRKTLAESRGVPPYVIFGDATLVDLCRQRPTTPAEFLAINGVGAVKLERFGDAFLGAIRDHST